MTRRGHFIFNLVAVNIGWTACVVGAAWGSLSIGPAVVAVLAAAHLAMVANRPREILLIVLVTVMGTLLDSLQVAAGTFAFDRGMLPGGVVPLWMMALWVNFSTALNVSLRFLHGKYMLAVLFGVIGGPIAYYAGMRFGAISDGGNVWRFLGLVGGEWALAMPAMLWISSRVYQTWKESEDVSAHGTGSEASS
ncbi:MAG: DUF2878 domain-containing protein [Planctomycetota bacterium]|jgi:hypothetical protein